MDVAEHPYGGFYLQVSGFGQHFKVRVLMVLHPFGSFFFGKVKGFEFSNLTRKMLNIQTLMWPVYLKDTYMSH